MTDTTPTPVATELGTPAGGSNETPGSVGTSPVDLDQIRADHTDAFYNVGDDITATVAARTRIYDVHVPAMVAEIEQLRAALAEMTAIRDHALRALRALHRDDYQTPIDLREEIAEGLYGIAEWDGAHAEAEEAPGWLIDAVMGAVHEHYARAIERADKADAELAQLRAKNDNLVRQVVDNAKRDVARISGRALAAAWEALRDAPGGPLLDAMNVITDLAETRLAPATTTEPDQ